jgi:hypothetical protein
MNSKKLNKNPVVEIPYPYMQLVVPAQYELVEKTWRKWNTPAREFLRAETGLKLSVSSKQHSVSISIENSVPNGIDSIINDIGIESWILGRKRQMLESLRSGTADLDSYLECNPKIKSQFDLRDQEIDSIEEYLSTLDKIIKQLPPLHREVSTRFKVINEDVLGAYFFMNPHIELYWIPIALIAEAINASIEDLTIIVLIHELAHAYTHIGMDIGGRSWETQDFRKSDLAVLEGLAQYYTYIFLASIRKNQPNVLTVFEDLLKMQHPAYHTFKIWMGDSQDERSEAGRSEAIRLALLDARLQGVVNERDFSAGTTENMRRLK